jgi:hypothetical protein
MKRQPAIYTAHLVIRLTPAQKAALAVTGDRGMSMGEKGRTAIVEWIARQAVGERKEPRR